MLKINVAKNRIIIYSIITAVLYIMLGITYAANPQDNPQPMLSIIIPAVIFLLGIINIKCNIRWLINIFYFMLFICIPLFIFHYILLDNTVVNIYYITLNYIIILAILSFFMALTLNLTISAAIVGSLAFIFFVLEEYIIKFRGTPLIPSDIKAFSTAVGVMKEYKPFLNVRIVFALIFLLFITTITSKLKINYKSLPLWNIIFLRIIYLAICIISIFCVSHYISGYNEKDNIGWDTDATNKNLGLLLNFSINYHLSNINAPDGYDKEYTESLLQDSSTNISGSGKEPNIIVIMNESFSDLTSMYELEPSKDPLEYWHSLKENTVSGNLLVSVYGGNTSITEFEFLTGMSNGILPNGLAPYVAFLSKNTSSLAYDLKKYGYNTIAMHPFWGGSWNRSTVYPLLGFDKTIFGTDFSPNQDTNNNKNAPLILQSKFGDNLEYVRNYISDRECYNKIIEQFENKNKQDKLFMFNVTIQNHGGYIYSGANYKQSISSKTNDSAINQYLSLVNYSDEAYKELINYFKNYDEPTVILMFGDHQPTLTLDASDLKADYKKYEKAEMADYIVPFKLWANYDIPEENDLFTSPSFLSLKLKDIIGLEYTEFDKLRKDLNNCFTAINSYGYWTNDNSKYTLGSNKAIDKLINDYKYAEYYELIDK